MQRLVSQHPGLLDDRLREAGAIPAAAAVEWVSPREDDDWAEYRDGASLAKLGRADLTEDLRSFWPARGPQWDALGIAGNTLLLVEAKAHVAELASTCTAEAPASFALITRSLDETRRALDARADADWLTGYYQLANRLAHLRFLQERGVDARLVLLQFTGDTGMPTASGREDYETALTDAMKHLGLDRVQAPRGLVHVFIDVAELGDRSLAPRVADSG